MTLLLLAVLLKYQFDDYMNPIPDLHDGMLLGVRLLEDSLVLWTSSTTGELYTITISKLFRLKLDNFLEGNIIFDIDIFIRKCPEGLIEKIIGEKEGAFFDKIFNQIRSGRLSAFRLTTSYGCELLALYGGGSESINVQKIG